MKRNDSKFKKAMAASFLIITFLSFLWPSGKVQASSETPPRVIIFLINNLNLDDLNPRVTPCLWELQEHGAAGLIIPQLGKNSSTWDAYCTISAGQAAVASPDAPYNFMAEEDVRGEKAATIFMRQTGQKPDDRNIFIDSIAGIKRNNQQHLQVIPGQLGDRLHELGYQTVVIGNSDRPGFYRRSGPLILMDNRGLVDGGMIDRSMLLLNQNSRLPYQSNYRAMREEAAKYNHGKAVLLFELGDLSRLDATSTYFSALRYTEERHSILAQMDGFIKQILDSPSGSRARVYVFNPAPSRNAQNPASLFTPLIISKPGFQGILAGYATRREGFLTLSCLQNSIINSLDPGQAETLFARSRNDVINILQRSNQAAVFRYNNQTFIMTFTVVAILAALLAALALTLLRKKNGSPFLLLSFVLAFPLSLLLISAGHFSGAGAYVVCLLALNLVIALLAVGLARMLSLNPLIVLLVATIAAIAGDTVSGAHLMGGSLLSYQLTGGARYYGLGNEYMGVLIGAVISLTVVLVVERPSPWIKAVLAVLFLAVAFIIGSPYWGVNVGGAVTAVTGLSYTFLIINRQRVGIGKILTILLGTVLFIALMAFLDLHQPSHYQSHLGQSIIAVMDGGPSALLPVIGHKLDMAYQFVNYTIWGWLFLLCIVAAAGLLFHPKAWLEQHFQSQANILLGLKGILLSMIVVILFNDSGLTAAATMSIYFFILILYGAKVKVPACEEAGTDL